MDCIAHSWIPPYQVRGKLNRVRNDKPEKEKPRQIPPCEVLFFKGHVKNFVFQAKSFQQKFFFSHRDCVVISPSPFDTLRVTAISLIFKVPQSVRGELVEP